MGKTSVSMKSERENFRDTDVRLTLSKSTILLIKKKINEVKKQHMPQIISLYLSFRQEGKFMSRSDSLKASVTQILCIAYVLLLSKNLMFQMYLRKRDVAANWLVVFDICFNIIFVICPYHTSFNLEES